MAPIVVQSSLLHIAHTTAYKSMAPVLLIVRPETFYKRGIGALVVDVTTHYGPYPGEVIRHRIAKFLKSPQEYRQRLASMIPDNLFNRIVRLCEKIMNSGSLLY